MKSIEARIAGLSCWSGKPKLTPLTGGLSTTSFLVEDAKGRFVARFGADVPAHHVFRDRECAASTAAAAAAVETSATSAPPTRRGRDSPPPSPLLSESASEESSPPWEPRLR